jgi:hypothetical protein
LFIRAPIEALPGPCGLEGDLGLALQDAIDVAAVHLAVIGLGHRVPASDREDLVREDQGLLVARSRDEGVQPPGVILHPHLEQEAGVQRRTVGRRLRVLGQVEPALSEGAAVGTEQSLEGELVGARQRVLVDLDPVVDAVEQHGLAIGTVDQLRVALDAGRDAADIG